MATMALRMHVRQWRALIWLGTVALTGVAGWNLWQIARKYRANAYEPRSATHFEEVIGSAIGSIDEGEVKVAGWGDYEALTKSPINGHVKEPPKPPPPKDDADAAPLPKPLTEVITVTAVTSAPDNRGRVVVKYKDETTKPTKDDVVLKIGASLTPPYDREPFNGRLKDIRVDSAIFDWCGADVEVHPARKEDVAAAPKPDPTKSGRNFDASLTAAEREALEKNRDQERTVPLPNDAGFLIGRRDLADLSANADQYLADARLATRRNADGKQELVVGQIRPNSYLARTYGVQPEDALISINGTPVNNKAAAYNYVREHGELSKYVVVFRRKGKEYSRTVLVNREGK